MADFSAGIGIDLVPSWGSKSTWFKCSDRTLTWFMWEGIEIDLILGWGSNWLDSNSGVEICLIFV